MEGLQHRCNLVGITTSDMIRIAVSRYLQYLDFLDEEAHNETLDNVDKLYREEYQELLQLALKSGRYRESWIKRKAKQEDGRKGGQRKGG